MKRWLREPLLHFLLAGAALFALYDLRGGTPAATNPLCIELTADDLQRLASSWTAIWQRPPTPQELQGLIDAEIREQVLYRQALALGLEQGDTIIRRRLVQKMEFLAEDSAPLHDPGDEELRAWFEKNRLRFAEPPRVTFRQIYFSFYKRQTAARTDAQAALEALEGEPGEAAEGTGLGDAMMFQPYYADRTAQQVADTFGATFAEALVKLAPGSWHGPVESTYGWHVVRIDSASPASVPPFEQIQPEVKAQWMDDQRAEARRSTYEALRARYQVVLPPGASQ